MRHGARPLSFVLLAILLLALAFSQQPGKCVALLTELSGDVYVKSVHGTEFRKAAWGTQLSAGDVVRTSSGASASILLSNNSLIELGPGSSVTISAGPTGGTKARPLSGVNSENVVNLSSLTMRSTGDGEVIALAGLRAGESDHAINQISPRKSAIRSVNPSFEWQSGVQVTSYRVKVFGKSGQLWMRETSKARLDYPANEKPLLPGEEYFWQVEGIGLVESFQSPSIGFSVLSKEAMNRLEIQERAIREAFADNPTSSSCDVLVGTLYQRQGLLEESIARFEAVAQRYPDASAAFEVLGKLYNDIGLKDKAIVALQRALKLTQQR